MEAKHIAVTKTLSASQKWGENEAKALLKQATRLFVFKGKKAQRFKLTNKPDADAVAAMLGPTGNLRAPTLRLGKTLIVGFNEEEYETIFS